MNKTTKGALAAGAAAVLLLGGAGTLAYWTEDGTVNGGTITAGELNLTVNDCDGWLYATADTQAPTGAVDLMVPGDVVENTCTATITGTGDHLAAEIQIDESTIPSVSLGSDALAVDVAQVAPAAGTAVDVPAAGVDVEFTITVTWPYGAENNDSELQSASLDGIAIQAIQVHDN